jgi:alpha-N-arabinofuranosidase
VRLADVQKVITRFSIRRLGVLAVVCLALAASGGHARLAAQTTPTSTIHVDFDKVQRVVPPFLFGQNLQTVDRGDGILTSDGQFNQQILDFLSEIKITTLRFPGGTAADYFHWWQALGPHSGRPKQPSGNPNEFYTPVVGPEEFMKLATALRAVPFITANVGTGSPEEAAQFAKYFQLRGFPVTYWEVGNEIYFEGILGSGLIGPPPDVYARKLIDYATAIRREAPFAKIYAAAVVGPEQTDSYWNSVVLGLAGPYIDGVSMHNAYYPLYGYTADKTVPSDAYLFTAMMGATRAVEHTLAVMTDQLDRLGRLIPIFVTEYDGIFYPDSTVEDPIRTAQRNPTLGAALFNASVLQILARNDRVHGAHHMALAGPTYGSLLGVDRGVHFRNPQFYVMREYSKEAGKLLVNVATDAGNATFDSQPVKLLSGQTGVPMLDAIATRDAQNKSYSLFVVNRSLTSSVQTSIDITLPAGVTGTVSVLNGPDYTSRNSADAPAAVSLTTTAFASAGAFSYTFPAHSLTIFRWTR